MTAVYPKVTPAVLRSLDYDLFRSGDDFYLVGKGGALHMIYNATRIENLHPRRQHTTYTACGLIWETSDTFGFGWASPEEREMLNNGLADDYGQKYGSICKRCDATIGGTK